MKLVADAGIPLLDDTFGRWAKVTRLPGTDIATSDLKEADALLVRSITPVNAQLLEGTNVRFVGTVTSGVDHIDQAFLRDANIQFAQAKGCNAAAVADYVCSTLAALGVDLGQPNGLQVGLVGLGEVGFRVAKRLDKLCFKIKAYDPFLKLNDNMFQCSWEEVLGCDVVSLHVPLTRSGDYPTYHLLDAEQLGLLPREVILINAARGAVIDNSVLSDILRKRPQWRVALDVWENEPRLNQTLLSQVELATPHIAGHSVEAKSRGVHMVYQAFLRCFCSESVAAEQLADNELEDMPQLHITAQDRINDLVLQAYDVREDGRLLPELLANGADISLEFESLRRCYRRRHEFSAFSVNAKGSLSPDLIKKVKLLNFNI